MSQAGGLGRCRLTPLSPTRRRSGREAYRLPSRGAPSFRAAPHESWPGGEIEQHRGVLPRNRQGAVPRKLRHTFDRGEPLDSEVSAPFEKDPATKRERTGQGGMSIRQRSRVPMTPRSRPAFSRRAGSGRRSTQRGPASTWPSSHTTRSSVMTGTPEVASQPSVVLLPWPLSPSSTHAAPACRNAPPWIAARPVHVAIVDAAEVRWGAITHSGAVGRASTRLTRRGSRRISI